MMLFRQVVVNSLFTQSYHIRILRKCTRSMSNSKHLCIHISNKIIRAKYTGKTYIVVNYVIFQYQTTDTEIQIIVYIQGEFTIHRTPLKFIKSQQKRCKPISFKILMKTFIIIKLNFFLYNKDSIYGLIFLKKPLFLKRIYTPWIVRFSPCIGHPEKRPRYETDKS